MSSNSKYYMEPESAQIEHKESVNGLPKEFWPTYSSFANTKGGYVYLGVREDKAETDPNIKFYVIGVNDTIKVIDELVTALNNPTKVSANVVGDDDIVTEEYGGMKVIRVHVREISDHSKPVYLENQLTNAYIRVKGSDVKLQPDELKIMLRESRDDLDSDVLTNYSIEDLSIISIERYRSYLIGDNEESEFIGMDVKTLLERLGVYKKDYKGDGRYGITAGGLLFFGKYHAIIHKYPFFHLDYQNKTDLSTRWLDRVASGDPEYPDLNVFSFYDKILAKLQASINQRFALDDNLRRAQIFENMSIALRESLANMLIHADYAQNMPLTVMAYHNYYEFTNPGKLKVPIETFFISNETKLRNPVLSILFRTIRVGERAGTGGIEIFNAAKSSKFRLPEIESDANSTMLRLWSVDLFSTLPNLSDDERDMLSLLTKSMTPLKRAHLEENLKFGKRRVLKGLEALIHHGLVIKIGTGPGTKYAIIMDDETMLANLNHMLRSISKGLSKE